MNDDLINSGSWPEMALLSLQFVKEATEEIDRGTRHMQNKNEVRPQLVNQLKQLVAAVQINVDHPRYRTGWGASDTQKKKAVLR